MTMHLEWKQKQCKSRVQKRHLLMYIGYGLVTTALMVRCGRNIGKSLLGKQVVRVSK